MSRVVFRAIALTVVFLLLPCSESQAAKKKKVQSITYSFSGKILKAAGQPAVGYDVLIVKAQKDGSVASRQATVRMIDGEKRLVLDNLCMGTTDDSGTFSCAFPGEDYGRGPKRVVFEIQYRDPEAQQLHTAFPFRVDKWVTFVLLENEPNIDLNEIYGRILIGGDAPQGSRAVPSPRRTPKPVSSRTQEKAETVESQEAAGPEEQTLLAETVKESTFADDWLSPLKRIDDPALLADIARDAANWKARRAAIERIEDPAVLADIAKTHADGDSRSAAVAKIEDPALLADIVRNDESSYVRKIAVRRIHDEQVLAEVVKGDADASVRAVAVERIDDSGLIADVARNDEDDDVREAAVNRLEDQRLLADIARNESHHDVREAATKRLEDQAVLAEIAKNDEHFSVRVAAVRKIKDSAVLADIARNDESSLVRQHAVAKTEDIQTVVHLAKHDPEIGVRLSAIDNLDALDVIVDLARNDPDRSIRLAAAKRIPKGGIDPLNLSEAARRTYMRDETVKARYAAVQEMENPTLEEVKSLACKGTGVILLNVGTSSTEKTLLCPGGEIDDLEEAGLHTTDPGEMRFVLTYDLIRADRVQCKGENLDNGKSFSYTYPGRGTDIYTLRDLHTGEVVASTTFMWTAPRCVFSSCTYYENTNTAFCAGGAGDSTLDKSELLQWFKDAIE